MVTSSGKLVLYDHPVSSYAQKVRIALREKGLNFTSIVPEGLGSGGNDAELSSANPRMEVPALVDGAAKIFESSVIMQYLEERFPTKPLFPNLTGAAANDASVAAIRAKARMIESICDSHYESINWGYGEVVWFERAAGPLAERIIQEAGHQTKLIQAWLTEQLGSHPYFAGDEFGYADVCVGPLVNRSVFYGMAPPAGSALHEWYNRIRGKASVNQTFEEMEEMASKLSAAKDMFKPGSGRRREYRDHRLEFLVKSGGIEIVTQGLKDETIRFSWPTPLNQ